MDVSPLAVPEHRYPAASAAYGALTQSPASAQGGLRSTKTELVTQNPKSKKRPATQMRGWPFLILLTYAIATSRTFTAGMFLAFAAASMYDLISLKFR